MRDPFSPPRWAEDMLEMLLPREDRLTFAGDLREEYAETVLSQGSRWKADLWYLSQAVSLAPRFVAKEDGMRKVLSLASALSLACGCWLVTMEMLLRHPGYLGRAAMDASISVVPLATILVILLHAGVGFERWFRLFGLPLIAIALWALVGDARSPHFEGFVLVVGVVLAFQGILMLIALGRNRAPRLGAVEGPR
jgi:hypothetical protein